MKTLFLHMGTHKTGTSALQVFFAQNQNALSESSIYYPSNANIKAAREKKITSGNGVPLANALKEAPQKSNHLAFMKKIINEAKERNILLSSETFSDINEASATELVKLCQENDLKITCIFYVRSLSSYATSQYSQLIKRHSYTEPLEVYVEKHFELPFTTIKSAIKYFGRKNVQLHNYEHHRARLTRHFTRGILKLDPTKFTHNIGKTNRSLTNFELEFLRHANSITKDNQVSEYMSDALIYGSPEQNYRHNLTKEVLSSIETRQAENLTYINSLGIDPKLRFLAPEHKISEGNNIKLNPFHRSVIALMSKMAVDHAKK